MREPGEQLTIVNQERTQRSSEFETVLPDVVRLVSVPACYDND